MKCLVTTIPAQSGCDTMVAPSISTYPIQQLKFEITICAGDEYTIHGETFSVSREYETFLTSTVGSDSILIVDMIVLPEDDALCEMTSISHTQSLNELSPFPNPTDDHLNLKFSKQMYRFVPTPSISV